MTRALALALLLAALATDSVAAQPDVRMLADSCGICHGTDGRPPRDGLERLAGMKQSEFIEEMRELKRDSGEGRLMTIIARGYSDREIRAMARYFSRLPRTSPP